MSYIAILEEQVDAAPVSGRSNNSSTSHEQYDTVINKLLKDNTRLHQEVTRLKAENEQLRQGELTIEEGNNCNNKNRVKFRKGRKEGIHVSCFEAEGPPLERRRSSSVLFHGKENADPWNRRN